MMFKQSSRKLNQNLMEQNKP